MKSAIHPVALPSKVVCASCGTTFETRSVAGDLTVEVCSACHPAYTGKTRSTATGSRVERFERRYARASRAS
jgi:large subunit ribosomal protein L31